MAQGLPSLIMDSVLEQLESSIFHSNKSNFLLRIQLQHLRSRLNLIKDVIHDAAMMAVLFPKFLRDWVCELLFVLHEVDDLLDEAFVRSMPASGMKEKVRRHIYGLPFDLILARKMKKINKRLGGIIQKCNLIVVEPGHPQPSNISGNKKSVARRGILRYDPDFVKDDEFQMIGRDDDKKKVIAMLSDEDPSKAVVLLGGEPGAGKSSLCRAVYNDEEVRNQFEIRLWVGLGKPDEFSLKGMWKKILTTLGVEEVQSHTRTQKEDQSMIADLIRGKKTLLVLDGFSPLINFVFGGPTQDYLSDLKILVATSHEGSKILLVALPDMYSWQLTCFEYELGNGLSEEDCWSIFEKAAFVPQHDRAVQLPAQWMIDMGKQIVRKCPGNPALLRGVGTLLYGNDDRAAWEYFARDFDFESQCGQYVDISEVNISEVRRCCPKLCHCLGYMSLFLEHEFKYEALNHQLAAHGFNYFPTLQEYLELSILEASNRIEDNWDADKYTINKVCKDVISGLAVGESAILRWTDTDLPEAVRHVSIARPSSSTDPQPQNRILPDSLINNVIRKRSLLFSGELCPVGMSVQTLDTLASKFRYLRVLDLHDLALKALPSSMGKLIHLRYLDLSRNDFKLFPTSICRLKNLQTLRLIYCDKLPKLPGRIKNLRHLKHLEINMCLDLTHLPSEIGRLTRLARLDRFVVGPHKGGLRYLQHLDNLNGHLSIELPHQWKESIRDAELASLKRKEGLTTLEIMWQGTHTFDRTNDDDDVLQKLEPCIGIENLKIMNFGGTTFPSWMTSLGIEYHLTEITISRCKRCQTLPPFHRMPHLKSLTLTSMDVEYVVGGDYKGHVPCLESSSMFFPSLEVLKIGRMPHLIAWSREFSSFADGLPRFPDISVEIWNCPSLTIMPPFSEVLSPCILQDVSEKMLQFIDWRENDNIELIDIKDMVSLPNQFVAKLPWELNIKDCEQLQMLWTNEVEGTEMWQSLSMGFGKLRHLSVSNCPTVKHLSSSLMQLPNLRHLTISKCNEELDCLFIEDEDEMPWKALQNLQNLKIEGFEKLVALPKGFQHVPRILRLEIVDCKALIWDTDNFPKSEYLTIRSCPHFSNRIEEIKRVHRNVEVLE